MEHVCLQLQMPPSLGSRSPGLPALPQRISLRTQQDSADRKWSRPSLELARFPGSQNPEQAGEPEGGEEAVGEMWVR